MEMFGTHHPDKCGSRWNSESNSIPASGQLGSSQPAFWASWADCLSTVYDRHPMWRNSRARLVVLVGQIGGRWSGATNTFVRLAQAKAREEPPILRRRVEQAWRLRWGSLLACVSARVFCCVPLGSSLRWGGWRCAACPSFAMLG